jgi:hypothetical protein
MKQIYILLCILLFLGCDNILKGTKEKEVNAEINNHNQRS